MTQYSVCSRRAKFFSVVTSLRCRAALRGLLVSVLVASLCGGTEMTGMCERPRERSELKAPASAAFTPTLQAEELLKEL